MTTATTTPTFDLGGDLTVHRLGYGAMQLPGPGVWGEPADRAAAVRVVRAAVEQGVDFIDTADSYGPLVSEQVIAEALHPTPTRSSSAPRPGWSGPGPVSGCRSAAPPTSSSRSSSPCATCGWSAST